MATTRESVRRAEHFLIGLSSAIRRPRQGTGPRRIRVDEAAKSVASYLASQADEGDLAPVLEAIENVLERETGGGLSARRPHGKSGSQPRKGCDPYYWG